MKRYHYERDAGSYVVFDRKRGHSDPLASCRRADDAQLIVDALNAAQDAKERNG